jgi:AcrR family transcriptional regulator
MTLGQLNFVATDQESVSRFSFTNMPPIKKIIKDVIDAHHEHHRRKHADGDAFSCCAKQQIKDLVRGKRARAVDAADKEARRTSILDAAEGLFAQTHEFANVAEVAAAAGLAKGTVYLYFQTKEEMYLALYTRNAESFFTELINDLDAGFPHGEKKRIDFVYMRDLVSRHMFDNERYMPLAALCFGVPQASIPPESAVATKQLITSWLLRAGAGIERHFPHLPTGEGLRLLNHCYAMMIGLHQLLGEHKFAPQRPQCIGLGTYRDEALVAIDRYWRAVIGPLEPVLAIERIEMKNK